MDPICAPRAAGSSDPTPPVYSEVGSLWFVSAGGRALGPRVMSAGAPNRCPPPSTHGLTRLTRGEI